MSILSVENLNKSYFSKNVLKDVSFTLDRGDKLGLIGHNGSGKTTLLRLISGKEEADNEEARIHLAAGVIPAYLEQEFRADEGQLTALDHPEFQRLNEKRQALERAMAEHPNDERLLNEYAHLQAKYEAKGAWDYPYRLAQAAASLGLDPAKIGQKKASLSGGERMRLALATILIQEPDLILLDEPTNHLDLEASEWLEEKLASLKSTLIVVSHDRHFLDQVCNLTGELNTGKLTLYRGNYSTFKELQAKEQLRREREQSKLEKAIEHEEEVVQTLYSHRKIASYHSRQKKLAKLNDSLRELKEQNVRVSPKFKLRYLEEAAGMESKKLLISARALTIQFPDAEDELFHPLDLDIYSGDKILFCGPNGCGKTNLLKALSARNPYLQGEISLSPNLRYASLDQTQRFPDPTLTVIESLLSYEETLTSNQGREYLAGYSFYGLDLEKPVASLSGGEKSRLALAQILLQKPDLIFLDEPTNHLDISSSEILESALERYQGTIVAVSHDRYFIERIGEQIYGFVGREVRPFPRYNSYRRAVKQALSGTSEVDKETSSKQNIKQEESGASLFTKEELALLPQLAKLPPRSNQRRTERQLRAQLAEAVRDIEVEIAALEDSTSDLSTQFGQVEGSEIYEEFARQHQRLENLYELYVKCGDLLGQLK
ncbi:MAG: ABC-F family ATP-binding cassette domain-containing protein [Eubacteriales bacterium]|nr:ABC-F family ATP-binding cassette domain-containing protein [Eubacteriales bacterium]